jgi:hypothetical protein
VLVDVTAQWQEKEAGVRCYPSQLPATILPILCSHAESVAGPAPGPAGRGRPGPPRAERLWAGTPVAARQLRSLVGEEPSAGLCHQLPDGRNIRRINCMTWIAPEAGRKPAPFLGDERTVLDGWLNYHRETLLHKCSGLTGEQLKMASAEPSTLTLLGMVRHMTDNEQWFGSLLTGEPGTGTYCTEENPEADLGDVSAADAEKNFAKFAAVLQSNRAASSRRPLDHTVETEGLEISLRGAYVHMIEEYARHNGHADLIRERIDGTVGD